MAAFTLSNSQFRSVWSVRTINPRFRYATRSVFSGGVHPETRLLDDRFGRLHETVGEADDSYQRDEPLRGTPLVPAHAVAKVGRELVVTVVYPSPFVTKESSALRWNLLR